MKKIYMLIILGLLTVQCTIPISSFTYAVTKPIETNKENISLLQEPLDFFNKKMAIRVLDNIVTKNDLQQHPDNVNGKGIILLISATKLNKI